MIDNAIILKDLHNKKEDAEEKLLKNNMGLVMGIAKRFFNRGYDQDEIIQVGSMGLLKAIRRFDNAFGVQFSTYAVPLIIGEIKRFIRDDGIIKVSRTHKTNAMKAWQVSEKLSQKLNRTPTIKELSEECDVPIDELVEAMEATAPVESIYKTFDDSDDKRELIDLIGAVEEEGRILDKILIKESLNILKPRERTVVTMRYFKSKTQNEISKVLGVSQVQVSRIEKAALGKLREFIEKG